jgi:1-deoxy-D-xylulose-5-phosphate synthase
VAIYSTFMQRGYDQFIHDVALQNLDVTFALDRAGLVGADGATHAGNYDIAFLRCVPNMVVATPSDEAEARLLLSTCYGHPGPASVRYPRGGGSGAVPAATLDSVPVGKGVIRSEGTGIAFLVFGTLLPAARRAAEALGATVADMRFVKPLDEALVLDLAARHDALVTIEESSIMGGAGSAVCEALNAAGVTIPVLQLGLPDRFIDHGDQQALLAGLGLDAGGIEASVRKRFGALLQRPAVAARAVAK